LKDLNQNKYKVLLLGDILKTNTLEQMNLLKDSLKYIKIPIQYLLKPHPATPITTKDCPDIDLIITDKPINEIVNCCQLVYAASTTSSSFDAYYLGAKVVTFVNPQGLNTSPLRGLEDAVFVNTPIELANILNKIDQIKKKTKKSEDILYIDANIPRWKKIFEIN
jgi:surface carbohydrate biosynthesis protein (TIGR04326 family)